MALTIRAALQQVQRQTPMVKKIFQSLNDFRAPAVQQVLHGGNHEEGEVTDDEECMTRSASGHTNVADTHRTASGQFAMIGSERKGVRSTGIYVIKLPTAQPFIDYKKQD